MLSEEEGPWRQDDERGEHRTAEHNVDRMRESLNSFFPFLIFDFFWKIKIVVPESSSRRRIRSLQRWSWSSKKIQIKKSQIKVETWKIFSASFWPSKSWCVDQRRSAGGSIAIKPSILSLLHRVNWIIKSVKWLIRTLYASTKVINEEIRARNDERNLKKLEGFCWIEDGKIMIGW